MLTAMTRSLHILSVFLLLTFASVVSAQTPLTCGIVEVAGPSEVAPGELIVFNAKVTGLTHAQKLELKWKLSAGTIASEGGGVITLDTAGLGGVEVIATAELVGAPAGCSGSASKTVRVRALIVCGLAFDEYGDLKFGDEKARLDNFAIQLLNDPVSIGYIFMSAGQETFKNETRERLDRAKAYLVNVRKVDANRIVTVDCGFTSSLTIKLRLVPVGGGSPECSNPRLAFSEVKFTKPRPKPAKKKR